MNNLTTILLIMAAGIAILTAGILITRTSKQSLPSALVESLFWGIGLFLCFSTEILIFENL
jgi:hypothetical protein